MATGRKPPYVLLGDRLAASVTPNFLGRIVEDMRFPNDEYLPDHPGKIFGTSDISEVIDHDVALVLEANKGRGLEGRLQSLFDMSVDKIQKSGTTIRSKRVITRSLTQLPRCFSKVYVLHKQQILKMLRSERCKGV